jgi:hypothetical protein
MWRFCDPVLRLPHFPLRSGQQNIPDSFSTQHNIASTGKTIATVTAFIGKSPLDPNNDEYNDAAKYGLCVI